MNQEIYTIEQYIEIDNNITTLPVGFFVDKKDRDDAMMKHFFFNSDDRLPSKDSLQRNRWAKKGVQNV